MKNTLRVLLFGFCLFCSFIGSGQVQIVVLGSSTAAGSGATVPDSSWVRRLQAHYRQNTNAGNPDTVITNLAVGGFTTYHVMPDNYTVPNRPAPVTTNNVTKAFTYNPQVIIINLPTNDIGAGYGPVEFMNNLRYLFQLINNQGIRAFITTTQPRTQYAAPERQVLRNLVDSINNNFGVYAIDFWTDLATTDGQNNIKPEVNSGDDIHINNLGHRYVFERVRAENLFVDNAPLPVRLTGFSGKYVNDVVELRWTTAAETAGTRYTVQRSAEGSSFTDIAAQQGTGTNGNGSYVLIDRLPLTATNYYRIKIQEGARITYSATISINKLVKGLAIKRALPQNNSTLLVQLENDKLTAAVVTIYNTKGQLLFTDRKIIATGTSTLYLPIQTLPSGQYVLNITAANKRLAQSFIK